MSDGADGTCVHGDPSRLPERLTGSCHGGLVRFANGSNAPAPAAPGHAEPVAGAAVVLLAATVTTACSSTTSGTATPAPTCSSRRRDSRSSTRAVTTTAEPAAGSPFHPPRRRRRGIGEPDGAHGHHRRRGDRRPLLSDRRQRRLPDRLLRHRSQYDPDSNDSPVDRDADRHGDLGRRPHPVQPRPATDDDGHRGDVGGAPRDLRPAGRRVGHHPGRPRSPPRRAGRSGHLRRATRPGPRRHLGLSDGGWYRTDVRRRLRRRRADRRVGLVPGQRASGRHRDLRSHGDGPGEVAGHLERHPADGRIARRRVPGKPCSAGSSATRWPAT